jgi:exopolyphosphatase/pppGpp-phosphohydrolase
MKPLMTRENARRMAQTVVSIRKEQGEALPDISTRRMQTLPANVLAGFASRPKSFRTVQLEQVKDNVIVLRYAAGR